MYDVNLMPDIPKLGDLSPGDFNVVREMNEKKEGKRKKNMGCTPVSIQLSM